MYMYDGLLEVAQLISVVVPKNADITLNVCPDFVLCLTEHVSEYMYSVHNWVCICDMRLIFGMRCLLFSVDFK